MARKKQDPTRCPVHINVNGVELRCEHSVGFVYAHPSTHATKLRTGDDSWIRVEWGTVRRVKPCASGRR